MFVKDRMTPNPRTGNPDMSVTDAQNLMKSGRKSRFSRRQPAKSPFSGGRYQPEQPAARPGQPDHLSSAHYRQDPSEVEQQGDHVGAYYAVLRHEDGQIIVSLQEKILDRKLIHKPDLLVLCTSIKPSEGTRGLAEVLDVPIPNEGFFLEAHIKMHPMDFMEEGTFTCGIAHFLNFIEESISQALATAGRVTTNLSKNPFHFGGTVAIVDPD